MVVNKQITPHFSLFELAQSDSHPELVEALRIQALSKPWADNLLELCSLLEQIRQHVGKPIKVNSGLRSKLLNSLIGGATKSEHLEGKAADIDAGTREQNQLLFNLIKNLAESGAITVGQLIEEHAGTASWVHVSTVGRFRNEFLTYDGTRYRKAVN